MLKTNL